MTMQYLSVTGVVTEMLDCNGVKFKFKQPLLWQSPDLEKSSLLSGASLRPHLFPWIFLTHLFVCLCLTFSVRRQILLALS